MALPKYNSANHVSGRLAAIRESEIVAVTARMAALKAAGRDVIVLSTGSPDFGTPNHVKQAAIDAIGRGETGYTDVAGTMAVRKAVVTKFKRDYDVSYGLDEVMVSAGGKQAVFNAMAATLDPGDEVIIPTPCWVSYPDIVGLADGRPVLVACAAENGFELRPAQLEAAITPKTRWFLVNNPCNPTCAVYSESELSALAAVLLRHPHVLIFTDDIYEKFVYDGRRAISILAVEPRLKSRTVAMNGCSKAYAMTGWRVGYCGAPAPLISAMVKLQGQSTSSASSISQAAALAALSGPQEIVEERMRDFERRRDRVVALLSTAPGLRCHVPEGAFYAFPSILDCLGRISAAGAALRSDVDFANSLSHDEGVGVVPGSAFLGAGHIRISYVAAPEKVEEACRRIVRFCASLT